MNTSAFTPAPGSGAANLWGVDAAKASFVRAFERAEGERARSSNVLITGPVGSGKTSLLRWASGVARERGWATLEVTVHPGLHDRLLHDELPRLLVEHVGALRMSRLSLRAAQVLNFDNGPQEESDASIAEQIRVLSDVLHESSRGTFIAIDEAHRVGDDGFRNLLAVLDSAVGEIPNLVLGMAALPEFTERIFRERLLRPRTSEDFVKLGLLPTDAAAAMLRAGFDAAGVEVAESHIETLASFSRGYPPMLQAVGAALVETAEGLAASPADVNRAAVFAFRMVHRLYYVRMVREMNPTEKLIVDALVRAGSDASDAGVMCFEPAPLSLIALADRLLASSDLVRAHLQRLINQEILALNDADQAEVVMPLFRESVHFEQAEALRIRNADIAAERSRKS